MTQLEYFKSRIEATFSPMDYMQESKQNKDEYVLLDVRNGPPTLKKEKIQGAIEIPLLALENRLSELPKEKVIVLYCWDVWCSTAAKAALILLEKGFKVKELSGGIAAWKTMNFPVTPVRHSDSSIEECGC
ncbi:rhodanese-like domain-containing protein [Lysinibacillus sp. NPDC096418]|uniref:rhodanese-like domain-containing protein n=1 Tax=Lysinibacillus sp. NPDC096418 TaxID=3364138 RepID=UPI0037FCE223